MFIRILLSSLLIVTPLHLQASVSTSNPNPLNSAEIEQLTGSKGKFDKKQEVFKVSMPRSDIDIHVGEVKLIPAMGLTSWAAFMPMGKNVVVMGDLVLLEHQVNPVMSVALDNGLNVTALHNHFLGDSPKVMFMHIAGKGDEKALASAIGKVFDEIKVTHNQQHSKSSISINPADTTLNTAKLDEILNTKGNIDNHIYKVSFGNTTKMQGHLLGESMGINTWAAFAGTDNAAVVDGDFAVLESELQNVLKELRKANIDIAAIHQHMINEQPKIIFLHYWSIGKASDLANGLKNALDKTQKIIVK
jgi:Domain of Unknown Function (DUF1259)